jgi:WD40 repeat protein
MTLRGVTFGATGRLAALVLATASPVDPAGSRAGEGYGVVVDLAAGRLAAPLEGPRPGDAGPTALAISPDGRWVATSRGGGGLDLRPLGEGWHSGLRRLTRTGSQALALGWDATGSRLAAGLVGGEVVVFDAADPTTAGRQVVRYPGQNPVSMVAFAADSDLLVSQDSSGAVAVRSLSGSTAVLRSVPSDSGPARALAPSPDGSVVAVGWDSGRVSLLDPSTLARVRPDLHLGRPADPADSAERLRVTALAFTADSEAVVAADAAGHLRMWSVHDGQVLWSRDDVPTVLLDASPDGRYLATVSPHVPGAAGAHDRAATVVIWDLPRRQEAVRPELGVSWDHPVALRFSPDSRYLALGLQTGPNPVFDVASGERVAAVGVQFDVVTDVAFSADGRRLILDRAGVLSAYDTRTWRQERLTLAGRRSGGLGSSIGVAPGGRFLVRGNERGEVDLVDAATLHVVAGSLPLPVGRSPRVAFGPDGKSLYVAGDRLAVWDVDPGRWMSTACDIVGRSLTKDEWDRFLPDHRYEPVCRTRSAA